jgi:hypothetical protein
MEPSFEQNKDDPPDSSNSFLNSFRDLSPNRVTLKEPQKPSGSFFVKSVGDIEVVSEIEQCFQLWQEFSPQKTLFDTWEFRLAFYRGYGYKPYFLLLKQKTENLALLPLWYDLDRKIYTWFGSDWQEEVRFFAKDSNYMPILISAAPSPLYLNAITKDSIEPIKDKIKFENDDPKYVLNLENFKNHEDFLMTLKKNKRRDLRKDRNRILRQNPEIIINNFADFDCLVELSKKRFREKGEKTDWEDPRRIETFREVIKLGGKSYEPRMITIKIKGKASGVDLVCLFKKTYFAVKCGYDVKNFSGIGNFMNLFEIDDALKLGMKKIDFLQNNYQWKDRFFEAIPLFCYKK